MNCLISLIRQKDNKIIKTQVISDDTYSLCEEQVKLLNNKIDTNKYWTITNINI